MYEELVNSLRCCAAYNDDLCSDCKYHSMYVDLCIDTLKNDAADAIEKLSAKVDGLQFYVDSISKLPDCNTCMKKPMCEFMPKYGEYCRINCPAWLGEQEPPKEE